jgi:Fe-S-cluster-containing dehydrogenase component
MREDRIISRRGFIGSAAAVGVAFALQGVSSSKPAEADEVGSDAQPKVQYGIWVNTALCDNCGECVNACREHNNTPEDVEARRKITEYKKSDFNADENADEATDERVLYVTTSCMHCAVPSCVAVCPAQAIVKRDDGIVDLKPQRCIGCKYCYEACPFGVPHYTSQAMDKCDCCLGAGIEPGDTPWCVSACPTGALKYGTTDALTLMSNGQAQPVIAPTGPSYFLS